MTVRLLVGNSCVRKNLSVEEEREEEKEEVEAAKL